jgi:uncharacterized protein YjbI with pentapeptide repeats
MAETTRLNLAGTRVDDADFSNARLHGASFEGAKVTDAVLVDADVSGDIEGLRINGVEVAPLVDAELERRDPERALLRAEDPAGFVDAWRMLEGRWHTTMARADALPAPLLFEQVDGEWSFVETLRHLIFATDIWLSRMVVGIARPYHPWGLAGSWLTDPASLGVDPSALPTFDEVRAVRAARTAAVADTIAALTEAELDRVCVPPEPAGHPSEPHTVRACLRVILNEEWEHGSYANRDLDVLVSSR